VANQITPNPKEKDAPSEDKKTFAKRDGEVVDNLRKNKTIEKNETKVKIVEAMKEENEKSKIGRKEQDGKLNIDKEKAKKGLEIIENKLSDEFGDKTRFGLLKEMKEELKNFDKNERKFSEEFMKKIELKDVDSYEQKAIKNDILKNVKVIEDSGIWGEKFRKKIKEKFSKNRNENYVDGLIKREIAENPELKNVIDKRNEFRVQINEADAKIKNLGDEKIDNTNAIYDSALRINQVNVRIVEEYEKKGLGERAGKAFANKIVPASNFILNPLLNLLGKETEREKYKKAFRAVKDFNNLETKKDYEKFSKNGEKKDGK
jgi:hypothetical protein